jgi:hypothetical protein
VPIRGSFVRSLVVLAVLVGGLLAVAGGLALRGPGLSAVVVSGVFAGGVCAAIAREGIENDLRATLAAAAHGAAWTVAALLAIAGTAALAGGVVAALVAGTAFAGAATIWVVRRTRTDRRSAPHVAAAHPLPPAAGGPAFSGPVDLLPPVPTLSTRALGQEWLRTSAILAGRLDPAARAVLVGRRQEALDELELRDPAGFARWMLAGPVPGSDPADYVRRDRTAGTDAA